MRLDVAPVMGREEASELVGAQPADLEATPLRPGTIIHDAESGAPVLLYAALGDGGALRRALLTVDCRGGVQRNNNYRSRSRVFGYAPPRPVLRREGCGMTSLAVDHPDVERVLECYADQFSVTLAEAVPDAVSAGRAALGEVLPQWRLGEEKLWTSGVINDTAQLPYHRDGFNFPTWSAMPVVRRGTRGGHLHLPEYGLVVPCADSTVVFFEGSRWVHGVTPIRRVKKGEGYRISVVYYALRGMKNCRDAAEETAYARARRTQRETDMAKRLSAGDRTIPKNTDPVGAGGAWSGPRTVRPGAGRRRARPAVNVDYARLTDLTVFARLEHATCDVEPWADIIARVELPREQRTWLMTLYNTYDDLHSAWTCMRRWSTPAEWGRAADRHDAARYNCTQERRNLRGGRVLQRFASYLTELGGRSEERWMLDAVDGPSAGKNFARLSGRMRSVWGVGRQSAFEWAEFAGKVLGLPVDAADGQLWESSGPRRCLERLFYLHNPSQQQLDDAANVCREYLRGQGVELSWVDFETIICDFNVMRDGRYYPGRHLAALREEIDTLPDRADRELLDAAWAQFVPDPWASIPPGINPDKMGVYASTGKVVAWP